MIKGTDDMNGMKRWRKKDKEMIMMMGCLRHNATHSIINSSNED